jgi:hypothetical protein
VEESPDQVLARLARYAESLKRPSPSPIDGTAPPPRPPVLHPRPAAPGAQVAAWQDTGVARETVTPAPARDWWHAIGPERRLKTSALRATLFGQLLGVITCVVSIFAFMRFERVVAYTVVSAMILVGAIAAARRVPLALWWTFGAVLGAVLGMWS